MANLQFTLTILKYLGLFLVTGSTIWGATNIISKEVDGKKKLTTAGKISVILTITGLCLSVFSNLIQDKYLSLKAEQANLIEIKKNNRLILSGQPLLSLGFSLKFANSNKKDFLSQFVSSYEDVKERQLSLPQGGFLASQNLAIELAGATFPLFNSSLKGVLPQVPENFLVLVALDETQNTVLSYGYLNRTLKLGKLSNSNEDLMINQKEKKSEGITFDLPAYQVGADDNINHPFFKKDSVFACLNWELNVSTLKSCINKQSDDVMLNANLPQILKVAILYDFDLLPFSSGNIASCVSFNIWSEVNNLNQSSTILKKHIYNGSSIELTPNNLADQIVKYKLKKMYNREITEPIYLDLRICNELLLIYERLE